jgi:hypothetical protein
MLTLARRVQNVAVNAVRTLKLRYGLASLAHSLDQGKPARARHLQMLLQGWDNEAWCASAPFLDAMLEWLPRTSGAILECGSGVSTLVLASACARSGRTVHSLEHDPAWASAVVQRLPRRLKSHAMVGLTPITSYGDFDWYAPAPEQLPEMIGFVVCDGPPGGTRGGRYGFAPILGKRLAPGCIVLLDDTQRAAEREIVERWCAELDGTVVQEGGTFTTLRIGGTERGSQIGLTG